jgi:hypothetical protein
MARVKLMNWFEKKIRYFVIIACLGAVIFFIPSSTPLQDEVPPTISNASLFPDPVEAGEPVNIICDVQDNVAVHSVKVFLTFPNGTTMQNDMTLSPPSLYYYTGILYLPGTYNYNIWANDTSDNTHVTVTDFFQVSDTQPPLVDVIYPNGGEFINGTLPIQWAVNDVADPDLDGHITLEYSADGGATYVLIDSNLDNTGYYDFDSTLYPDGSLYLIAVGATDDANNTGVDASDNVFTIDNTPPITNISLDGTPGRNGWYLDEVLVALVPEDVTSGISFTMYRMNDGNWTAYTDPILVDTEGNHSFEYYSLDTAGNREPVKTSYVKIDWSPPEVTIVQPLDNYLYLFDREIVQLPIENPFVIGDITIKVAVANETSGVNWMQFQIDFSLEDNVTEEPWEWLWEETSLISRRYVLYVGVFDMAGNDIGEAQLYVWKWL